MPPWITKSKKFNSKQIKPKNELDKDVKIEKGKKKNQNLSVCLSGLNRWTDAHRLANVPTGPAVTLQSIRLNFSAVVLCGVQKHEANDNTDLETRTTCSAVSLHSVFSLKTVGHKRSPVHLNTPQDTRKSKQQTKHVAAQRTFEGWDTSASHSSSLTRSPIRPLSPGAPLIPRRPLGPCKMKAETHDTQCGFCQDCVPVFPCSLKSSLHVPFVRMYARRSTCFWPHLWSSWAFISSVSRLSRLTRLALENNKTTNDELPSKTLYQAPQRE